MRFMIKCDQERANYYIWYHGHCVKISARRETKMDKFVCFNCAEK